MSSKLTINLDNFDESAKHVKINSPRSMEALASLGIDPHQLLIRPLQSFDSRAGHGKYSPRFAERRFAHFEQRRQAYLKAARKKRNEIIASQENGKSNERGRRAKIAGRGNGAADSVQYTRHKMAHLLEREQREVQKLQELQVKQMNQLLQYEIQMQKQDVAKRKAIAEEEKRAEARRRKQLELQRQRELQKQWEAQEKRRKEMADEQAQREANQRFFIETQHAIEEKRRRDTLKREKQRLATEESFRRQQERKRALDEMAEQNRIKQQQKLQEIEERERRRHRYLAQKQELNQRRKAVERARAEQRIKDALDRKQQQLEQRRLDFEAKERRAEEILKRDEHLRLAKLQEEHRKLQMKQEKRRRIYEQAEARLEGNRQRALEREAAFQRRKKQRDAQKMLEDRERNIILERKAQRRQQVYENNILQEEARIQAFNRKKAEKEEKDRRDREARELMMAEHQLEQQLIQEGRREHVARLQRVQEYKNQQLVEQMWLDDQRIAEMKREMEDLQHKRHWLRQKHEQQKAIMLKNFNRVKKHLKLEDLESGQVDAEKLGLFEGTNIVAFSPRQPMTPRSNGSRTTRRRKRSTASTRQRSGSRTSRY